MRKIGMITAVGLCLASAGLAQEAPVGVAANDYPTSVRADYVFACMAVNGQSSDVLNRCSCSIDTIASILTYDDYVSAETVLRMRLSTGERSTLFRGGAMVTAAVADLRRAQAEAEIICF